jgi:hypothetical protein
MNVYALMVRAHQYDMFVEAEKERWVKLAHGEATTRRTPTMRIPVAVREAANAASNVLSNCVVNALVRIAHMF